MRMRLGDAVIESFVAEHMALDCLKHEHIIRKVFSSPRSLTVHVLEMDGSFEMLSGRDCRDEHLCLVLEYARDGDLEAIFSEFYCALPQHQMRSCTKM